MKIVKAKIVENSKEDPASEPDQDPNIWLIVTKLGSTCDSTRPEPKSLKAACQIRIA